jgi:hypothetical protein
MDRIQGIVIGSTAAFLVLTTLVCGLLVQRYLRRSAEASLRLKTEELDQFFNLSLDVVLMVCSCRLPVSPCRTIIGRSRMRWVKMIPSPNKPHLGRCRLRLLIWEGHGRPCFYKCPPSYFESRSCRFLRGPPFPLVFIHIDIQTEFRVFPQRRRFSLDDSHYY